MLDKAWREARRRLHLERRNEWWQPRLFGVAAAALIAGLVSMYLFDPRQGRGRRHQAVDRVGGTLRRVVLRARRGGRQLAAAGYGVRQRLLHIGPDSHLPENDATLKSKVESILFRDPQIAKGDINVNAEEGVIVLRGTARTPDQVNEIERGVRSIHGVADVRNLLHLPNTPAPEWEQTVLAQRQPVMSGDRG